MENLNQLHYSNAHILADRTLNTVFERLEPCEAKVSCTVLMGRLGGGNTPWLPGDNLENRLNEGKQMTAMVKTITGASSASLLTWEAIEWHQISVEVKRLQMRIAKAVREKRYGKAKALQWLLTHSFSAKLLAVKRVVLNSGAKTPGVDGVVWKIQNQKMQAALSLQGKGLYPAHGK